MARLLHQLGAGTTGCTDVDSAPAQTAEGRVQEKRSSRASPGAQPVGPGSVGVL